MLDQPLRRLGVVGAGALLLATAAFGGLQEQTQDGPEVLTAEAPYEVAPFELTVHRVRWTGELPGQFLSAEGNRWIAVVATVRNTSEAGVLGTILREALTLDGVDGLVAEPGPSGVPPSAIAVLADGSSLSPVQPGLTYEAVFLFEQAGDVDPPTTATVHLLRHTWRRDSLDQSLGWLSPETALRGELEVTEVPSEAEEAES